jgi:hypothetical protein
VWVPETRPERLSRRYARRDPSRRDAPLTVMSSVQAPRTSPRLLPRMPNTARSRSRLIKRSRYETDASATVDSGGSHSSAERSRDGRSSDKVAGQRSRMGFRHPQPPHTTPATPRRAHRSALGQVRRHADPSRTRPITRCVNTTRVSPKCCVLKRSSQHEP